MDTSISLPKNLRRKSLINATLVTCSPLRKSTTGTLNPSVLLDTPDDEEERSKRRSVVDISRRLTNISSTVSSPLTEISNLVNENQLKDHLKTCTKLYTENKISIKNAWELHVIDVIRKVLATDNNNVLQVGGTSLDIGAKVYACRVDDLHSKGLKLASYWGRKEENETNAEADNVSDTNTTIDTQTKKNTATKKRKKLVGDKNTIDKEGKTIFAPLKLLEPVLFSTKENIDVSATDNLFTYKLHINPATNLFTLLSDEKYWTTSEDATLYKSDQVIDIEFPEVSQTRLCESFKNFEIGDWDPETEENGLLDNETMLNNVVLDDEGLPMPELDGSIPNIFENDNDAAPIDSGSDVEEHQEEFQAQIHGAIANVVDIIPEESRVQTDYGYNSYIRTESGKFIERIWAGPSHWKIKYIRPSTAKYSGSTDDPTVKRRRKTKVIQPVDFTIKPENIPLEKISFKRAPATTALEKITLPVPDICYENFHTAISDFLSKPGMRLQKRNDVHQQNEEYEIPPYNYDNPNDSHYCSQHHIDEENEADIGDTFEEEGPKAACENFLDEHLLNEPDIVNVDHVPYALQAKKMDMKKLKAAVWRKLTQKNDAVEKETVQPTKFSQLYKELPEILNNNMRKELSCSLAFVALLHLCNENNLKLSQTSDDCFKDFIIQKAN